MADTTTNNIQGLRLRVDFDAGHVLIEGPDGDADALATVLSDIVRTLMRAAARGDALAARDAAYYMTGALSGVPVELIGQPADIRASSRARALA